MEETQQQTNHQHQPNQHQARYDRAYTYMKRPEFLLLLGLVNLLLILCVSSRMHRMMHYDKMEYGYQQMQMQPRGQMMRGNQGYSRTMMPQSRSATQQIQYQESQDMNQAQPNDAVMTSPTQPEAGIR